jgi:hypothetical protein
MPNLMAIGDNAFQYCSKLYLTELPDSITEIGSSAFGYCTLVQLAHMPKNVTKIQSMAFANTGLTLCDFTYSTSLTDIGQNAFLSCKKLQSPNGLPTSITTIGEGAFMSCANFAFTMSADRYPNLISIASSAFNGTSISIESLPENLEKIYNLAFATSKGIMSFESIPSSVTLLGTNAFLGLSWSPVEGGRTLTLLNPAFEVNDQTGYFSKSLNGINSGVQALRVVNQEMLTLLQNTNGLGSGITDIAIE